MPEDYKSIVFINQSSGYLMIDIINAHSDLYDEIILLTGFLNPRETPLNPKVKVKYLSRYDRENNSSRFISWLKFYFQCWYYVFFKFKKSNFYFVSNPSLTLFLAAFKKAQSFVYLIYDIYPAALSENNIISKHSVLYRFWNYVNKIVLKKAKSIYTISEGMKSVFLNEINTKKDYGDKVKVIPVWTNNNFFISIPKSENIFLKKYQAFNKFIIAYSGNLGKTHPIEFLIESARHLKYDDDIIFFIIGEGDKKSKITNTINKEGLKNIKVLDFQPTEIFPHSLAAIDIGVVTLEENTAQLSVPSKLFNLMSVAKPVITVSNNTSELAKIINKNNMGENFSANDVIDICNFIIKLKENKSIYDQYSLNSKKASLNFTQDNAHKMIF